MHISFNYIIQRLQKTYRTKGAKGLIASIVNYLNSKLNPKHVGELPFKYLFLKKRRLIKNFAKNNLDKLNDINIVTIGNYVLNENLINSESIVYSFGVGTSISFEEKISKRFNCKVFCYDPTSLAKNFMDKHEYDKDQIKFIDYGIWIEDKKIKFYNQNETNKLDTGGSITNLFKNQSYDLLQCYRLKTLMEQNNHERIDVLKLDIEGAAVQVLQDAINSNIQPRQIIAEFECSEEEEINEDEFNKWSLELKNLLKQFRNMNYKIFYLPRYAHIPYSTIEVLMQKNY